MAQLHSLTVSVTVVDPIRVLITRQKVEFSTRNVSKIKWKMGNGVLECFNTRFFLPAPPALSSAGWLQRETKKLSNPLNIS